METCPVCNDTGLLLHHVWCPLCDGFGTAGQVLWEIASTPSERGRLLISRAFSTKITLLTEEEQMDVPYVLQSKRQRKLQSKLASPVIS